MSISFFFFFRFTRIQRVTCCLVMLMLTMLASAMFYGTVPERSTNGFFGLGLVSFDPIDVRTNSVDISAFGTVFDINCNVHRLRTVSNEFI